MLQGDGPAVDYAILADRAEVINGKLYMMGGGWEAVTLPPLPGTPIAFYLALGVSVPWHATNREHLCTVRVDDADGQAIASWSITLNVGRPTTIPTGSTQRISFALPVSVVLPAPGAYRLVCAIGAGERQVSFQATAPWATPPSPP